MADVRYDRAVLVTTLIYHHWHSNAKPCGCGWRELGKSHAEHVADEYEHAMQFGLQHDWKPGTETHASFWCSRCGGTAYSTPPEYGCEAVR